MGDVADTINVLLKQRGGTMIDYKQELYDDLDQLRDYACTMKRAATDMLDWIHVIETDMQSFIESYTGPSKFPDVKPEQEPKSVLLPMEQEFFPGSPCIDPDGEGCKCYIGCTADCLPSEYKDCKCPRKVLPPMTPKSTIVVDNGYYTVPDIKPGSDPTEFDEADDGLYTLTEKGELICRLVDRGMSYLEACQVVAKLEW